MTTEINWFAVLLAFVASMVLAKVWFSPILFGPAWRKLTGISPEDSKKVGKRPIILTLFANILTVIALTIMIHASGVYFSDVSLVNALLTGVASWLAFSATTLATHNAFEQKPLNLTFINVGYQFVLFILTALIIGLGM
jgi:hypothetical protein